MEVIRLSEELIDLMQQSVARELAVSTQYMWHHVMGKGLDSPPFRDMVKKISIAEMKHAEDIAERLDYYGVTPTTKPVEVKVGGNLEEMIADDLAAEKDTISLYRKVIDQADTDGDVVTRDLFEQILSAEEDHARQFSSLLQ